MQGRRGYTPLVDAHRSDPKPLRISAVMNTLNEEGRITAALRSLKPWVDEIVVVDMDSEDRTVEIAAQFGAQVFQHPRLGYADPARAFAVGKATGDWILMLDADEVVPPDLGRKLRRMANDGRWDVIVIPWVNYLLGRQLRYTGWGPHQDRHPRFFRRGAVDIRPDIHSYIRPASGARILTLPYREGLAVAHFNYVDVRHFIEKLNRYTDIEAATALARGQKPSVARAVGAAVREFGRRYLRQRGWRDGWRGFYLSLLMAGYRIVAEAKLRELTDTGGRERVLEYYRQEARRWYEQP